MRCGSATCVILTSITFALPAAAEPYGSYSNSELGLKVEPPEDWTLTLQTGYPRILAVLTSSLDPATVSVAVEDPSWRRPLRSQVADNNRILSQRGFRVLSTNPTQRAQRTGWEVVAQTRDGRSELRQVYLEVRGRAVVFTLTAPRDRTRRPRQDFLRLLDNAQLAP
ncbi:MAG: hypothetical protein IT371_01540 [Deltaproteobacteria bacterium]|nr:hypothetical protein [Deltaproteobacteria bacterium]